MRKKPGPKPKIKNYEEILKQAEALANKTGSDSLREAHTAAQSEEVPVAVAMREAVSLSSLQSVQKTLSGEELRERIKLNEELMALDGNVQICLSSGIMWLECEPKLIAHLCGGKFPEVGYMIYKNVRLCKPGSAEDIAKKEKLTIEQIMFPKNGEMFVGSAK